MTFSIYWCAIKEKNISIIEDGIYKWFLKNHVLEIKIFPCNVRGKANKRNERGFELHSFFYFLAALKNRERGKERPPFFLFQPRQFWLLPLSIRPSSRRQEIYSSSCGLNRGATRGALILLDTTISDSVHASTGIFHEQYFDLSIMLEDSTIRCLDMIWNSA
jgi:hypothetical protein